MTLQVKLSDLAIPAEEFAARVVAFAEKMAEYAAHLEGVKIDTANPDLKPEDRRVAFPPPSEDDLIARAAHEGYEFAGPSLEEKKAALLAEVKRIEAETVHAALPPAKQRHWHFREQDIRAEDENRLKRVTVKPEPEDIPAFLHTTRAPQDTEFLSDMITRRAKADRAQRWSAQHEHDIADLTHETVDQYVIGGTFS